MDQLFYQHPTAVVDPGATIGAGSKVWHFSHILPGVRVGERCIVGQNVMIGPYVSVGSGCKIQNNVSLYKGITLEDDVFCGPSCVFTNVHTPRAFIERKDEFRSTLVKRGATIGANATILSGITLGQFCLIGAGAVVTKSVPNFALFMGVPAHHCGWVCTCGISLNLRGHEMMICPLCGSEYLYDGMLVEPR